MTYYIAAKVGLNSNLPVLENKKEIARTSEAYLIAWADQTVDEHPKTQPFAGKGVRERFHFRAPAGEKVEAGSDFAAKLVLDGMKAKDAIQIGIGLHAYQDSWSHAGYTAALGHSQAGYGGHAPDLPWTDPDKALKMAKATYDMLAKYRKDRLGRAPATSFDDIAKKIMPLFREEGNAQAMRVYEKEALNNTVVTTVAGLAVQEFWAAETKGREIRWQNFIKKETGETVKYERHKEWDLAFMENTSTRNE
jgi:hypothetical protein